MVNLKIILLGPPGAGKGTQAKLISSEFNIPHISTGDIFRKNIKEETKLGKEAKNYIDKGLLVPDELTVKIIDDRLKEDDCQNGYMLDGFPRTIHQADILAEILKANNDGVDRVILIKVPSEYILKRMTGRRMCSNCGASYHLMFNPSKEEGVCDLCGGKLYQRKDDSEETVNGRIDVYNNQTEPLVEYYTKKNILCEIDGTKTIEEVFENIKRELNR